MDGEGCTDKKLMNMKNRVKFIGFLKCNKLLLIYIGMVILLCLTFHDYIIDLFRYLVNHILWRVEPFWGMTLLFFSFVLLGAYIYSSTKRNTLYIQNRYVAISILVALFNSYFRVIDSNFIFWGIIIHGRCVVSWSDVSYILAAYIVYKKIAYKPYEQKKPEANPLVRDCAITNREDDFFGYQKMVDSLLVDLYATDVGCGSFSVGIAGKWGVGKSSFVNLLRAGILEKDGLVVDFFPRSSMSVSAISLDFFNSLSNTLKNYHTGSWHIVDKYVKSLRSIEGEGWFNKTIDAIEVFAKTDEKERLQGVIDEIGRKIFVIIDDLDRLTAPEILEVLKIIDRNGSFRNVFFIVAYDKEYVNVVLRKYLGYEGRDMFTDKYFNYEYSLPAHNYSKEREYVSKYIAERVAFGEGDTVTTSDLLVVWNRIGDSVVRYLGLMRHVKRFINILMSRLKIVKDDVNIEDFVYLTLLRYNDLDLYYQLSTADILIAGNHFLEGDTQLLYLKENAINEIEERTNGWKNSSEILQKLFPVQNQKEHYNMGTDYRKIRTINAFDDYFFDAFSGKLYHKNLRSLFTCSSEEEAICKAKEMFNLDRTSLVQYLQSRSVKVLSTKANIERYLEILMYLYKYSQRDSSLETLFFYFGEMEAYKELEKEKLFRTKNEYKKWHSAFIKQRVSMFPVEIGGLSLTFLKIREEHNNFSIYEQSELVAMALLCQTSYIQKWGEKDWDIRIAFQLSDIKVSKKRPYKYVKKASEEILMFMNEHVQYFIDNVVDIRSIGFSSKQDSILSLKDWFVPSAIFLRDEYTFKEWLAEKIVDEDTKYVMGRIYEESLDDDVLTIHQFLPKDSLNFHEVANLLQEQEDKGLDGKVLDTINESVGLDLSSLSNILLRDKSDIQKAFSRLYSRKKCSSFWLNLKDKMEDVRVGDFVRLKNASYQVFKDSLSLKVNAFVVKSVDSSLANMIKLKGIEDAFPMGSVEAIPIDGIHDLCIYYDPIIAAGYVGEDGDVPHYETDYRYFVDHFKNVKVDSKGTMYDEMKNENIQFVHEAQHWLKKEYGDDALKINKFFTATI